MSGSEFSPPESASRVPVSCRCARVGPRGMQVPWGRGFIPSSHCHGTAAGGAVLSLPACPEPGFLQETCKGHRPPGISPNRKPPAGSAPSPQCPVLGCITGGAVLQLCPSFTGSCQKNHCHKPSNYCRLCLFEASNHQGNGNLSSYWM